MKKQWSLDSGEMKVIEPFLESLVLERGSLLFEEGSKTEDLYFLEEGLLDVVKAGQHLANIKSGEWVGEISPLIDKEPRIASVFAKEKSTLKKLSFLRLKAVAKEHPILYTKIVGSLLQDINNRSRLSSESSLLALQKKSALDKTRILMGNFLVNLLVALVAFFYFLKIFITLKLNNQIATAIIVPLLMFLTYFIGHLIRKSGYPLKFYGLTFHNWKKAIIESVGYTAALLLIVFCVKWVLWSIFPDLKGQSIFRVHEALEAAHGAFDTMLIAIVYALFAPLQELVARGCIQGSLENFLVGKHKTWIAIILASLIFGTCHLQISLKLALYVLFAGCLWGWLYSRHRTIIGASLSHAILAIWVILGYL